MALIDIQQPDVLQVAEIILGTGNGYVNRKYRCPRHEDNSPSLNVSNGQWYCFSCEKGGRDAASLVAFALDVPYREALQMVAEGKFGPATRPVLPPPERPKLTRTIKDVAAAHAQLDIAAPYLEERCISIEVARLKQLGVEFWTRKRIGKTFKIPRLVIPYFRKGELVGAKLRRVENLCMEILAGIGRGGYERLMDELTANGFEYSSITPDDVMDYLCGPRFESWPGSTSMPYHTELIFPKHDGKPRKWTSVLITEGELDALALLSAGDPAMAGKDKQGRTKWDRLLASVARPVIVADNDPAGIRYARNIQLAAGRGVVVFPPNGAKDANQAAQMGLLDHWMSELGISKLSVTELF